MEEWDSSYDYYHYDRYSGGVTPYRSRSSFFSGWITGSFLFDFSITVAFLTLVAFCVRRIISEQYDVWVAQQRPGQHDARTLRERAPPMRAGFFTSPVQDRQPPVKTDGQAGAKAPEHDARNGSGNTAADIIKLLTGILSAAQTGHAPAVVQQPPANMAQAEPAPGYFMPGRAVYGFGNGSPPRGNRQPFPANAPNAFAAPPPAVQGPNPFAAQMGNAHGERPHFAGGSAAGFPPKAIPWGQPGGQDPFTHASGPAAANPFSGNTALNNPFPNVNNNTNFFGGGGNGHSFPQAPQQHQPYPHAQPAQYPNAATPAPVNQFHGNQNQANARAFGTTNTGRFTNTFGDQGNAFDGGDHYEVVGRGTDLNTRNFGTHSAQSPNIQPHHQHFGQQQNHQHFGGNNNFGSNNNNFNGNNTNNFSTGHQNPPQQFPNHPPEVEPDTAHRTRGGVAMSFDLSKNDPQPPRGVPKKATEARAMMASDRRKAMHARPTGGVPEFNDSRVTHARVSNVYDSTHARPHMSGVNKTPARQVGGDNAYDRLENQPIGGNRNHLR